MDFVGAKYYVSSNKKLQQNRFMRFRCKNYNSGLGKRCRGMLWSKKENVLVAFRVHCDQLSLRCLQSVCSIKPALKVLLLLFFLFSNLSSFTSISCPFAAGSNPRLRDLNVTELDINHVNCRDLEELIRLDKDHKNDSWTKPDDKNIEEASEMRKSFSETSFQVDGVPDLPAASDYDPLDLPNSDVNSWTKVKFNPDHSLTKQATGQATFEGTRVKSENALMDQSEASRSGQCEAAFWESFAKANESFRKMDSLVSQETGQVSGFEDRPIASTATSERGPMDQFKVGQASEESLEGFCASFAKVNKSLQKLEKCLDDLDIVSTPSPEVPDEKPAIQQPTGLDLVFEDEYRNLAIKLNLSTKNSP